MTREEWCKRVEWMVALGRSTGEAIRLADRVVEREKELNAALSERFNEYGMPRSPRPKPDVA